MAERLESLVAAQRLLLRDVSHELRSPLARLSLALQLAREDDASEAESHGVRDQHLDRIEREANNLNQLIGQLLTPVINGIAREHVDLSTGCRTRSTRRNSGHAVSCFGRMRSAPYRATASCCIVAIENVVRNAIRYTDPNTLAEMRIAETNVEGQRFAMLEVTDCGPGIPETELAHIFRPFYRVDPSRTSSTGGFGVGLAITEARRPCPRWDDPHH